MNAFKNKETILFSFSMTQALYYHLQYKVIQEALKSYLIKCFSCNEFHILTKTSEGLIFSYNQGNQDRVLFHPSFTIHVGVR